MRVSNVSITYRTTIEQLPTLQSRLVRLGRGQRSVREISALKNVSFSVPSGTSIGVIGANGAGKSTLMRAVAGILPPTSGRIEVRGRVSTLLAMGVGFNANLSGRENILLGGLAAGLSREQVRSRAEDIAAFAELGDFMDMPMRTYSSGMFSRLAFSVAVHMEPDILLIDEALATGDARYKQKAAAKMREILGTARGLLLVSHALGSIRELCDQALWLHKGDVVLLGKPDEVVPEYTRFLEVAEDSFSFDDL